MPYSICLIPGDGIGREVVPAAARVLQATGLPFHFSEADAGWECFLRRGDSLPAETVSAIQAADATLFGAVSSPAGKVEGYRSPIVAMRQLLGLYANLRPARSWPVADSEPNVDMLIVRENTEGLYVRRERMDGPDRAIAERIITREASAKIGRKACELAAGRRGRLTIVHKANILPLTCGLFRDAVRAVAGEFPNLHVEELLVDAMAMRLVRDPQTFDVVVTTNMFGDILSDEAAAICGGMGLAPSANIGEHTAVFEPVHGSAPDIAGRGVANPLAAILSAAMLLDYLGQGAQARRVEQAVEHTLRAGVLSPDLGGQDGTQAMTEAVLSAL